MKLHTLLYSATLLLALFLPLFHNFDYAQAAQETASPTPAPTTVFLPFKIIAAAPDELTAEADQALTAGLAARHLTPVSRSAAEELLRPESSWPPESPAIRQIAPTVRFLSAGTLTAIGGKISLDVTLYDLDGRDQPVRFFQTADTQAGLAKITLKLIDDVLIAITRHQRIAAISIKGNKRIEAGAILRLVKSQAGSAPDSVLLREDLKNIYQMGFFEDVRLNIEETAKGKTIVFEVKEKPVIGTISYKGQDEIKEEKIKEVVTIKQGAIINPAELKRSEENIRNLYKDSGYHHAEITTELDNASTDLINISFTIKENEKVYIKEIKFIGNKALSSSELTDVMKTTEKGWFSWFTDSGQLKKEVLAQDITKINAYYQNNGFIEAKAGEPQINETPDGLTITVNISEGERYRVAGVDITGELIEDKTKLLETIKIGKSEFFSQKTLREDILKLTDIYSEKGFAFAEIKPQLDRNPAGKQVTITITIHKGPLVHINRIIIKGNTQTRDKVIRRELEVEEGGIFNSKALRTSHQRLQRLDFFENINLSPEPTIEENLMDIILEAKEKATGKFSVGVGYSSVDHMMFTGEVVKDNFLGRGQKLGLQANLSGNSSRYNISFTDPYLNDSKLLAGIDLYNWNRTFTEYTKNSKGFSVRFGYPIWELWRTYWSYNYDDTVLSNIAATASREIRESVDINYSSSVSLSFKRDSRDRPFASHEGSFNSISFKYAGGILGGDSAYSKTDLMSSWFFPLPWETTFNTKFSAGYLTENSSGKLPIYEKFYLGGIGSIRGFKSSDISPRDPTTNERIGGTKMWYTNLEYVFPLAQEAGLLGVVFFDAGKVYDRDENWSLDRIKRSVGLGFRWLSPIGPLRLEWGYNLKPIAAEGESQSNWDFSLGGGF